MGVRKSSLLNQLVNGVNAILVFGAALFSITAYGEIKTELRMIGPASALSQLNLITYEPMQITIKDAPIVTDLVFREFLMERRWHPPSADLYGVAVNDEQRTTYGVAVKFMSVSDNAKLSRLRDAFAKWKSLPSVRSRIKKACSWVRMRKTMGTLQGFDDEGEGSTIRFRVNVLFKGTEEVLKAGSEAAYFLKSGLYPSVGFVADGANVWDFRGYFNLIMSAREWEQLRDSLSEIEFEKRARMMFEKVLDQVTPPISDESQNRLETDWKKLTR